MTRNLFIRSIAYLLLLVGFGNQLRADKPLRQAQDKPNILFIFADDQSYETIAALGHTDIDTPNLDRLANNGTVFTHTYNMGGWHGAICVASRTMINTGRFLWRARELDANLKKEVKDERMWSQLMRNAGYETFFTGKWHVNADTGAIFDHVSNVRPGMPGPVYYPEAYSRPVEGQPDPWSPTDPKFEGFWAGGTHWSEVVANNSERFLDISAESEKPFFMYLAFNAPHDPRQAPQEYLDKYPLDRIKVPENYADEYPYSEAGNVSKIRDEVLAPSPRTEYAVKVHRREYYAIITHLDAQIGRILDKLEATGQADNTYIFFTADHGLAVGHHGFIGKQNMYEHSLRSPLIVVGPDIPKGKKIDTRVYLQDVMPTSLELGGVPRQNYVEFQSLLPLIEGKKEKQYDYIYGAYEPGSQRALISQGFKMIYYPRIEKYRLYNLNTDPMEMNDLAPDPKYKGRLNRIIAEFSFVKGRMADPLVMNN
jgi:arylsulfatase A-like enzyme